jgi:hypothetical protein
MDQKPGIALDIDDTLADTLHHFVGLLQDKFPNPENLTVDQVIEKYKIVPNMKFWQVQEVKQWLEEQAITNKAQEAVPVNGNAKEIVWKINEILPVRMYITSRPSIVVEGTTAWLRKHGFPEADIVTRPHSMHKTDGNAWKAEILKAKYPAVIGIVDDNPEIIPALGKEYPGTVYLFGSHFPFLPQPEGPRTVYCENWDEVFAAIQHDAATIKFA